MPAAAETLQAEQSKILDEIFTESGLTEKEKAPGYLTEVFVPVSDGAVYTPINQRATAVENGFYAFQLFNGTAVKNMLAINEDVAREVLAKSETKLLFNEENVVVGIAED